MDVIALNKYLLGASSLDNDAKHRADVDQNGSVDTTDSLNILKYVVEIIDSLPISNNAQEVTNPPLPGMIE